MHSTPSDPDVLRQPEQHLVQFYASEGFLAEGLSAGEPAVVIATQAHRDLFLRHLQARAIDVAHLIESKRLVMLDAEATLAEFMVAGAPEPERFAQVIGGLLAKLAATTTGKP